MSGVRALRNVDPAGGPTVGEHAHTEAVRRTRTTTRPVVDWLSSPTGSMFRSASPPRASP